VQSTGSRKRTSPRLHNRQPGPALEVQQNKRLRGSVKALYPLNEEGSVPSPSRNNHHGDDEVSRLSDDLLEPSQNTVIPETQLPGVGGLGTISTNALGAAVSSPLSQQSNLPISQGQGVFSQSQDGEAGAEQPVSRFDPILTASMADHPFEERVEHFLGDFRITQANRDSVELCILCEAGRILVKDKVCNKAAQGDFLVSKYKELLSKISVAQFGSSETLNSMKTKLKGGQNNSFNPKTMLEKWNTSQSMMKKIFAHLPANYYSMKSGNQIYDIHQDVIRDHYKLKNVSNVCIIPFAFCSCP
jgi:hypothetical protein